VPPYTVQKLVDEPIVVTSFYEDYRLAIHGQQANLDIAEALNTDAELRFCIFDTLAMSISFNDILQGTALAIQQYKLLKNPNAIEVVLITDKSFMKAAMEGLRNPLFGNIRIPVFNTVEAGLAYARSQIAGARS